MLMKTSAIDFHAVEDKHREIHARLENWARWCHGARLPSSCPMFVLSRATARARGDYGATCSVPVDREDAARIAKAVIALPTPHRAAINWSYVKPVSPRRAAQAIGTSFEGLALYVRDGRQMLVNRGV